MTAVVTLNQTLYWLLSHFLLIFIIFRTSAFIILNICFQKVQPFRGFSHIWLSKIKLTPKYDLTAFNSQTSTVLLQCLALSPQPSSDPLGMWLTLAWHNFSFAKTPIPLVFMFTMYCFPPGHPPPISGGHGGKQIFTK